MNRTPQFSKSADPAVIAAIEANDAAEQAFRQRALDFAHTHGGENAFAQIWAGPKLNGPGSFITMEGVGGRKKPTTGSWTRYRDGWRPFKSDPLYSAMREISVELPDVPGVPNQIDGPTDTDGTFWTLYPRPFVHDGAAWLGFSKTPAAEQGRHGGTLGEQWVEVLASEFADAKDAARKEATR